MAALQTWGSYLRGRFSAPHLTAHRWLASIYVQRPRLRAAVSTACAVITQRDWLCAKFSRSTINLRTLCVAPYGQQAHESRLIS